MTDNERQDLPVENPAPVEEIAPAEETAPADAASPDPASPVSRANGVVLGLAIGLAFGAVAGLLTHFVPVCLIAGVVIGGGLGLWADHRAARRAV